MSVIQPNLPTARASDFQVAPPPLDIGGIIMSAYRGAVQDTRNQTLMREHLQDRELDLQDRATSRFRQGIAFDHQQETWGQQKEAFGHQKDTWKRQDEDHDYQVSQRPVHERLNELQIARSQAGIAATNIGLANATLQFQSHTSEAQLREQAINYVNQTATGQSVMPVQAAITSYGYEGDLTPDKRSAAGVGAFVSKEEEARIKAGENTPNRLKAGDIALSPDMRAEVEKAGVKAGEPITLHFADGSTHVGRYADHTAEEYEGKKLRGRFDIYSPNGPDKRNGKQIVGFSKASPSLPSADQLDRMMSVAQLTHDPAIIGRAAQVKEANELRPEVQAQRATKAWMGGFGYYQNRIAALPEDVAGAVSRMAGISDNPNSLPPMGQPQMWTGIADRLDKAIDMYNKDPATFRRVQIGGEARTPILPRSNGLTAASLSHLITAPDVPQDLKDQAKVAYAKMIEEFNTRGKPQGKDQVPGTTPTTTPSAKGSLPSDLESKAKAFMQLQ